MTIARKSRRTPVRVCLVAAAALLGTATLAPVELAAQDANTGEIEAARNANVSPAAPGEDAASTTPGSSITEGMRPRDKISRISGVGTTRAGTVPEVHNVRSGDTLWDITARYYRNAYLWPAVWSYNPHITNPHWIYPGDLVFLKSAGGAGLGGAGGGGADDLLGAFSRESGVMVMAAGYYEEDEIEGAGRIVFSPEEKTMLTLTDEVNIDYKDDEVREKVPRGLRLAILHREEAVVDPETDEEVAHKLVFVGTAQVVWNDGETLPVAKITDVQREIERGDLLLPLEDSLFLLKERRNENEREQEARIIDAFAIATQFGEQMFVLVNRGTEDGLSVGNRLIVAERREGLYELDPEHDDDDDDDDDEEREEARDDENDDEDDEDERYVRPGDRYWPRGEEPRAPRYPDDDEDECDDEERDDDFLCERDYALTDLPWRRIGEVVVVKATEHYSTVLIMDSTREFNIGHRVFLRPGY